MASAILQSAALEKLGWGAFYAPISWRIAPSVGTACTASARRPSTPGWAKSFGPSVWKHRLTALGAGSAGRNFDVSIVASAFGWNDPAGVLLFQRGWGIHDRQTALFGELPRPLVQDPSIPNIEFFDEVDDRMWLLRGPGDEDFRQARAPGFALRQPEATPPRTMLASRPGWTRFDAFGARVELPFEITAISQYMRATPRSVRVPMVAVSSSSISIRGLRC